MAKQRHLRPSDYLGDDNIVVVRGGDLDPEALRFDAERYHAMYGDYGLSVFAARDVPVDELAQQAPLVRFEVLTLVRVGVLRSAAFRLEPTVGTRGTSPWPSTTLRRASRSCDVASIAAG